MLAAPASGELPSPDPKGAVQRPRAPQRERGSATGDHASWRRCRRPSPKMTAMIDTPDSTGANVEVVERFLAAFDRRWPAEEELAELVSPQIRFTKRPNLV